MGRLILLGLAVLILVWMVRRAFGPRQGGAPSAPGAPGELVGRRRLLSHALPGGGTAQGAAHQPDGGDDEQDQHHDSAHGAIITLGAKAGGRWSG